MWYAQSEANYREAFRVAREAGEREPEVPVVMFFDEVDAVGGARGESPARVDDRVLTAFMAELDGLEARGNVLVVAATNRRDALDPALLRPGRLGDLVLEVPRPDERAAVEIFGKHLPADIPYRQDAGGREELIADAVARVYAPNAARDLATLTYRDGKRRPLRPRDLVSGAFLAKVARAAVERACLREVEGGVAGVGAEDLLESLADALDGAARVLTPHNCRRHLDDLPQDVDVVRVELAERRPRRPHRYLHVA
jgi:proteasome-associated ATPase